MNVRRTAIASRLLGYRGLGLIVILLFLAGSYLPGLQKVEDAAFGAVSRLVGSPDHSRKVVLLAIDDESLERLGPWPWPRARIADAVDRLSGLKAGAIGLMVPLNEPQTPARLDEMSKGAGASSQLRSALRKWARRLDTDGALSQAMSKAGNVVIFSGARRVYERGPALPWSGPESPPEGRASELRHRLRSALFAPPLTRSLDLEPPLPGFEKAAAAVGVLDASEFAGGGSAVKLVASVRERFHPTFVAQLLAQSLGVSSEAIEAVPGEGVRIGRRRIQTATDFRYYPPPLNEKGVKSGLRAHPLADLWRDDAKHGDLRGATVIVGPTAPGLIAMYGLADRGGAAPAVHVAHALSSLIEQTGFTRPVWFYAGQRGLIAALALLLLVPAGFHGRRSLLLAGALVLVMLNAGLVALVTRQMWLPVALPSLCAACVLALIGMRRAVETAYLDVEREANELRLRYAGNLHAQNKLEEAFDEYRRCPRGRVLMDKMYQLGLDFERRRKLDRAAAVYRVLLAHEAKYQDVRNRLERLDRLGGNYPGLSPAGSNQDTVLIGDTNLEKPILGHYEIERQIGRGAMAQVYLAIDLKLNRAVALKVLSIRADYHGSDVAAIEQRFRREAEAEARMNHPNIVTVYEAGQQGENVYIAMDYVDGTTLEEFTDPDNLLPVQEVVSIGIQAAKALDYAHGKEIIHRDVKPSNVLYMRERGLVKVSDFGIARLSDADQTRTGTILGTPSYMSPEQAVGGKVDGRSDLFSLGTTLYQLLSGTLPFTGDSVPSIMLQITKEKHRSLARVRPDLKKRLSRVIDTALKKDPGDRFQSGQEMAEALEKCREPEKKSPVASGKSRRRSNGRPNSRSTAA